MMELNRRMLLGSLMATGLLSGCLKATATAAATPPWRAIAARFLTPEGRIVDTGNGRISHSEGQGYAMLLAEQAADWDGFDRLWRWTDSTLARKDVRLFSWKYDPAAHPPVGDPNDAADGDMLIAWALLRAGQRWNDPDLALASAQIRAAILAKLVARQGGRTVLLPGLQGFAAPDATTINLSYYVWPALDAFAKADGPGEWDRLIADGEALVKEAGSGIWSLPTDWTDIASDGKVAPAQGHPPRFGFDALRIPLYLLWSRRAALAQPFAAFWRSYGTVGQQPPAWIDVTTNETAPYPLSRGAMAIAGLFDAAAPNGFDYGHEDYYSAMLAALAGMARQG